MARELQALAVLLLVLAVAWLGYSAIFGEGTDDRLTIAAIEGTVRRVAASGEESGAAAGDVLEPRDRVVAGAGSRAVLSLGPSSRVTVEEQSSIRVVSLDQKGVRLELEGGRVQATIRPGSGQVGITAGGRGFTTEDADLVVVRDPDGTVGATTTRGSVDVEGVEGATRLAEGDRLVAVAGGAGFVAPATEELLLDVAWPRADRTRDEVVEVRGTTEPGATVRVGGTGGWTVVKADARGEFVTKAGLTEGSNEVRVEAISVLGASTAVVSTVIRDTTAPNVGVEIHY